MSETRIDDLIGRLEEVGGELRIAGTEISVREIFALSTLEGQTAEDIHYRYPQLTMQDAEAAIVCAWVNRDQFRRELECTGFQVPSYFVRPSDRSAACAGTTLIVLVVLLLVAAIWSKIEFARLPNVANANFLVWSIERWGISGFVVLLGLVLCIHYLIPWFLMWSTRLPVQRFPMTAAGTAGIAAACGFCALHVFIFWLAGQPPWNREAWEARGPMIPVAFIFGGMVTALIVKIRNCQRAFAFSQSPATVQPESVSR